MEDKNSKECRQEGVAEKEEEVEEKK